MPSVFQLESTTLIEEQHSHDVPEFLAFEIERLPLVPGVGHGGSDPER